MINFIKDLFKALFTKKHIYSRQEIGKMSCNEFRKNEKEIMRQLKAGLINK